MAKAGRKRKQGKRTASGQLSRAGVIRIDRGAERTADKFSVYGEDGSDAIGRAYHHGLLGEDGLNLRNAARSMFRAYWPMFSVGRYQCAIADKTGGAANDDDDTETMKRREDWMKDKLGQVDKLGLDHRRAFDQLCINPNPDCGPDWLDRLIEMKPPMDCDRKKLDLALDALKLVAGG